MFTSNLLFIVAIAICGPDIPEEKCSWIYANDLKRHWVYRPTKQACIEFAKNTLLEGKVLIGGDFAKVYCIRAQTFEQADTAIIRM